MHLRLGRLVLRSYRSYVMWLPAGYKSSQLVYLVEARVHDEDEHLSTLGAFTTKREAESCVKVLESQGYPDITLSFVAVHERLSDWQWDR
jgi:hypothetical protein